MTMFNHQLCLDKVVSEIMEFANGYLDATTEEDMTPGDMIANFQDNSPFPDGLPAVTQFP